MSFHTFRLGGAARAMTVPIAWKKLGPPTEPGPIVYRDCVIDVRPQDIAAVDGDEDAIVHVRIHISGAGSYFRIASVERSEEQQ